MRTRDQRLLWDGVRLAVLDIETVWDPGGFAGPAREETDRAIEAVRQTGQPVRLAPQPRKVRWRQHATIEAAGLTSMSHGQDPKRAVEVRPRPDALPVVPPGPRPPGGEAHAAWIAIVECERGTVGATWQSLVNPGVPVDPVTGSIHRLTDEQLRDAPPFASLADELVRRLTPAPGELLVLAGHNLGYDIGVLRAEMRRIGKELPDLPLLDTMGHLAARVGKQAGLSLLDLLAELGLPAPQPHHSATEDARATAAAACRLLDLAADAGDFDMPTLLGELGAQTVLTLPVVLPSTRATKPVRAARAIPDDHAIAHVPLSPEPEPDEISRWITLVEECAALRCPDLATSATSVVARSIESLLPGQAPAELLGALTCAAEARALAGDGPGTATVLDAVGLVFDLLCPVPLPGDKVSYPIPREPTIALWHRLRPLLDALPRCDERDGCPRCWEGRPCGRDELASRLAPAISNVRWSNGRMETSYSINHWLAADGRQGWFSHRQTRTRLGGSVRGAFAGPELADATLAWLLRHFRVWGDSAEQDRIVSYQIGRVLDVGGCCDPGFWEIVALDRARGGREADLLAAVAACDEGLGHRPAGTTASAWMSLDRTAQLMRLRLIRAQRGHAVRHHPGPAARRQRDLRFAPLAARTLAGATR